MPENISPAWCLHLIFLSHPTRFTGKEGSQERAVYFTVSVSGLRTLRA